jgi:hypothetical protein
MRQAGLSEQQIIRYIGSILGIPPDALTNVTNTGDLARLVVEAYLAKLAETERGRTARIDADTSPAKAAIADLEGTLAGLFSRTWQIRAQRAGIDVGGMIGGTFPGRAVGGTIPPGPFWVGEAGPEIIVPEFAGRVLSHPDSMRAVSARAMMGSSGRFGWSAGGGGTTYNDSTTVIVNVAPGVDSAKVRAEAHAGATEALRAFATKRRTSRR